MLTGNTSRFPDGNPMNIQANDATREPTFCDANENLRPIELLGGPTCNPAVRPNATGESFLMPKVASNLKRETERKYP